MSVDFKHIQCNKGCKCDADGFVDDFDAEVFDGGGKDVVVGEVIEEGVDGVGSLVGWEPCCPEDEDCKDGVEDAGEDSNGDESPRFLEGDPSFFVEEPGDEDDQNAAEHPDPGGGSPVGDGHEQVVDDSDDQPDSHAAKDDGKGGPPAVEI